MPFQPLHCLRRKLHLKIIIKIINNNISEIYVIYFIFYYYVMIWIILRFSPIGISFLPSAFDAKIVIMHKIDLKITYICTLLYTKINNTNINSDKNSDYNELLLRHEL